MSRSCQNGDQQPCNITVIVVVKSKVHCRWNKDPLLQFYRQLHISSKTTKSPNKQIFVNLISVCPAWFRFGSSSPAGKCSYTSFHAHTAREQRHAHSHTHTRSSNSLTKLLLCTRVFSHQGHEHFKVFCQQNHLNWLPLVCAACHRGQRWRQHSWTQGPSPPSSIPPHLLKHLKVPHSVSSYANLRVKQSILTKRLYATL